MKRDPWLSTKKNWDVMPSKICFCAIGTVMCDVYIVIVVLWMIQP